MTIKESLYFHYAGEPSTNYGIINVNVGTSGMLEEQFIANREILETTIRGRDKPYFQGLKKSPLIIPVSFAIEDKWDENSIRDIARYLTNHNYYQPLYFSSNINRIYYALTVEDSTLIHNTLKQGYINLNFRCDSNTSYSPQYLSSLYDLSSNSITGTNIIFTNNGDEICKPEIFVEMVGNGGFSIQNLSDGGQILEFTNLLDEEQIYIDCENEDIISNISEDTYRYDNHIGGVFLEILRGVNQLVVKGDVKLRFRYQFKTIQG